MHSTTTWNKHLARCLAAKQAARAAILTQLTTRPMTRAQAQYLSGHSVLGYNGANWAPSAWLDIVADGIVEPCGYRAGHTVYRLAN